MRRAESPTTRRPPKQDTRLRKLTKDQNGKINSGKKNDADGALEQINGKMSSTSKEEWESARNKAQEGRGLRGAGGKNYVTLRSAKDSDLSIKNEETEKGLRPFFGRSAKKNLKTLFVYRKDIRDIISSEVNSGKEP